MLSTIKVVLKNGTVYARALVGVRFTGQSQRERILIFCPEKKILFLIRDTLMQSDELKAKINILIHKSLTIISRDDKNKKVKTD